MDDIDLDVLRGLTTLLNELIQEISAAFQVDIVRLHLCVLYILYNNIYSSVCVCVCVCVCVYIHIIYIHIYIFMCVCVCV